MDQDSTHARAARSLAQLNGHLQPETIDALHATWQKLEHAAVDSEAHARAIRARMFWTSLSSAARDDVRELPAAA